MCFDEGEILWISLAKPPNERKRIANQPLMLAARMERQFESDDEISIWGLDAGGRFELLALILMTLFEQLCKGADTDAL